MMHVRCALLSVALVAAAAGGVAPDCSGGRCATAPAPDPSGKIEAPRFGTWGIDVSGMDPTVRPGDDFDGYVSGLWARSAQIPPDRTALTMGNVLTELSQARLHRLVESYRAGDPSKDNDRAKIAALYRSFLDEDRVEALDDKPLRPLIDSIRNARSKFALARLMGTTFSGFGGSFFSLSVGPDAMRPNLNVLYLGQGGLGVGDREIYLEDRFRPQRDAYGRYLATLLRLARWPEPDKAAAAVLELETRIAQAQWSRADSRDRTRTYNVETMAQLRSSAREFPWDAFLSAAGLRGVGSAIVSQPSAVQRLAEIYAVTDLGTLKAWQACQTVDNAAPFLSKRFAEARFDFRQKFIQGQPRQPDRWKRAVAFAQGAMGQAIGRDYVRLYFPPESKAMMERMIADLLAAMRERLQAAGWMSSAAKTEALRKLANFGVKVGYPGKWKDYSKLRVANGALFLNAQNVARFQWQDLRRKVGRPVDRSEWGMNPQDVNAGYSYVNNDITFPAGILEPPFFDPKADPAVNYGAIGAVIGHEISHAFDDQGSKTDSRGLLRDWWTSADAAYFAAEAAKLGRQYAAFEFPLVPEMHINPQLSMGENIADLGGVVLAFDAYRMRYGTKAPLVGGFTGEQRLFLGWAQVWRSVWRKDSLRQQILNNPHAPGQIRAFASLRNIDAWYDAFGVKKGDKLFIDPPERVRIW